MNNIINIGCRRELFVDDFLIDRIEGAALKLQPVDRREVVFQIQGATENACTGCYNFSQVDNLYYMYYRGHYPIGQHQADWAEDQTVHLAQSNDGINFERARIGLVEHCGTKDNNVVFKGYEGHNFCVFHDTNPGAPENQRFKAVGGSARNKLYGFYSADGRQWHRLQDKPLQVTGAFDSVNVPLWDPHTKCYRLFSRYFDESGPKNIRAIQSCTSEDFIRWTEPEPHLSRGLGSARDGAAQLDTP